MPRTSVDYLGDTAGTFKVPVSDLKFRILQSIRATYDSGEWNPDNDYSWVPGAFYNFTPKQSDSRIRYRMRLPMAWVAAGQAIGHFRFQAVTTVYWTWSDSGTYYENAKLYEFDIPSWGTYEGKIGLRHRAYADGNHEMRMYSTNYWDGVGSRQNSYGLLIIEEYMP